MNTYFLLTALVAGCFALAECAPNIVELGCNPGCGGAPACGYGGGLGCACGGAPACGYGCGEGYGYGGYEQGCESCNHLYGANNCGQSEAFCADDIGAQSHHGAYVGASDKYYEDCFNEQNSCCEEVEEISRRSSEQSSSKSGSCVDYDKAYVADVFDDSCMHDNKVRGEAAASQCNVLDCDSLSKCYQDNEHCDGCGGNCGIGCCY